LQAKYGIERKDAELDLFSASLRLCAQICCC